MAMCSDQIVGAILSSWRYDISGIPAEMRVDYERHLEDCPHCRSRQRLHRTVDVVLAAVTTLSALAFLLALAVIHRLEPLRGWAVQLHLSDQFILKLHLHQSYLAITLQDLALFGLLVSLVAWALVALMTPAPTYLTTVAVSQARVLERELRNRGIRKVA
jgi:hypothetical protein